MSELATRQAAAVVRANLLEAALGTCSPGAPAWCPLTAAGLVAGCIRSGGARRGVKQAQLQGNTKVATTFTIASSMGPWPAGHAGANRARGQDRRRLARAALAGAHSPRHVKELGPRRPRFCSRTSVDPSLGHSQRRHPGRHAADVPSRRAVPCDVAVFRSFKRCIPDARERHSCPLRPRWHLRRLGHEQSMAAPVYGLMSSPRSHEPLRRERGLDNWVASTACPQSKKLSKRPPRPTLTMSSSQAHRAGARSGRPVGWAMAEASDDEDDASMPDAPLEPELIDMPPAPASARPMSNLERCIALRLVYGAEPR